MKQKQSLQIRKPLIISKLQNENKNGRFRPSPRKVHNNLSDSILQFSISKIETETGQFSSLHDTRAELCKEKKMFSSSHLPHIEYIPPKLTQGRVWYISFSCRHPVTGKMKRVRIKFNRIASLRERKRQALAFVAELDMKLRSGWNPFIEDFHRERLCPMTDVLDRFLEIKSKESEADSMRSYKSFIKTFKTWLRSQRLLSKDYCACSFTRSDAAAFLDDAEMSLSAATYNNYLRFFRTLFNWMEERQYISDNPFAGIRRKAKRLTAKTRRMFSADEMERLISYLEKENPQYLAIVLLCYCCFIRPKEIALLRCGDIDLENQAVHVGADIAKNDKESFRTIPDSVMKHFSKLDLSHPELFVFSADKRHEWSPGTTPITSRKISNYWNNNIRSACGFPMELQFYSLKDTGITNMINAGVALTSVQQQADHSSIAITSIYVGKNRRKAAEDLKNVDI